MRIRVAWSQHDIRKIRLVDAVWEMLGLQTEGVVYRVGVHTLIMAQKICTVDLHPRLRTPDVHHSSTLEIAQRSHVSTSPLITLNSEPNTS
jgi:hypothetical protein